MTLKPRRCDTLHERNFSYATWLDRKRHKGDATQDVSSFHSATICMRLDQVVWQMQGVGCISMGALYSVNLDKAYGPYVRSMARMGSIRRQL